MTRKKKATPPTKLEFKGEVVVTNDANGWKRAETLPALTCIRVAVDGFIITIEDGEVSVRTNRDLHVEPVSVGLSRFYGSDPSAGEKTPATYRFKKATS